MYDYDGDVSKHWFILYKDANGKRHKIQKGINVYKTARERKLVAQRFIKDLLAQKKAVTQNRQRKKVFDYIELRKSSWAKKTYQAYKCKAGIFFDWLGDRPVNKATIQGFFREYLMKRTGITYNTYKFSLSALFKYALDLDMKFILDDIEKRKSNTQTPAYFSQNR